MAASLKLEYDREGDILHIDIRAPYAEQHSQDIGDEVIARLNPQTGEVENLEVLFFSRRLQDDIALELPLNLHPIH